MHTKEQVADILTKGSFTDEAWNSLRKLCVILPLSSYKRIPETNPTKTLSNCYAVEFVLQAHLVRDFRSVLRKLRLSFA